MSVSVKISKSTKSDFSRFIKENYEQFSSRIKDLCESHNYIDKLYTRAIRYEIYADNKLVAVLCAYLNTDNQYVYIPYLCVSELYSGKGYATLLFYRLIKDSIDLFKYIDLEVRIENYKAYHLYLKLGFKERNRDDSKIQMRLQL